MTADEQPNEVAAPGPRGDAAWRAQRDAVEQRNAAAKKRAHEQDSATTVAASERERRLALAEDAQLRALNARLDGQR
ncbi:MAG TPA: hypothetical protein VH300_11525 [Thermoleophilaceae bacterium]|nr:hypothetical protein [Thermoleophilaceae bacterium]